MSNDSPYRPPRSNSDVAENSVPSIPTRSGTVGLWSSIAALLLPLVVIVLNVLQIIEVSWDSVVVPAVTLFAGLTFAVLGIGASIYARIQEKSKRSVVGIVLGVLAIPVVLASAWLLAMVGLAQHPV